MPLIDQLARFAPERAATRHGAVQYRRACAPGYTGAVTHVLLHGIGSASASWLAQLLRVQDTIGLQRHVLAWDAPGYGQSDALPMQAPDAADYAARMWDWIATLDTATDAPFTLVGHSLGALMAARAAVLAPARVARLVLLAPAQGYARAPAQLRTQKLADRMELLAQLGPAGMARKRAAAMLSTHASSPQIAFVEQVMAAIDPHGYTQAARMLAGGDLSADLQQLHCPVTIASGSADTITPPAGCQALAQQTGASYVSLGEVGHSCALEAAVEVNQVIGIEGARP